MRALMIAALLVVIAGGFAGTTDVGTAGVVLNTPVSDTFVLFADVDHVDQTSTLVLTNGPANGVAIVQFTIWTTDGGQPVTRSTHSFLPLDSVGSAQVIVPLANITMPNDATFEVRAFYLDPTVPEMPFIQSSTLWTVDLVRLTDAAQLRSLDQDAWDALKREIANHQAGGGNAWTSPMVPTLTVGSTSHAFAPDNPSSPTCPDLAGPGVWFSATSFSSGPAGVFTVN